MPTSKPLNMLVDVVTMQITIFLLRNLCIKPYHPFFNTFDDFGNFGIWQVWFFMYVASITFDFVQRFFTYSLIISHVGKYTLDSFIFLKVFKWVNFSFFEKRPLCNPNQWKHGKQEVLYIQIFQLLHIICLHLYIEVYFPNIMLLLQPFSNI